MPSPVNNSHSPTASTRANNSASVDNNTDRDRAQDSSQNPPPRPPLRSNFELEPNPFEQSFSVSSSSSFASLRRAANQKNNSNSNSNGNGNGNNVGPSPPSPGKKSPSAASSSTQGSTHSRKTSMSNGSAHSNGDTPKPTLPPLASITSPSDPSYAWSFSSAGLTNSLRAGPLSPAMLAGPQTQQPVATSQPAASIAALAASAGSMHPPLFGFDASGSFRTGLTPSTGLTPLVGGPVAFPPPSPNTAAFLAMVNSGAAGSAAAATITPNTLNALAGVLQQSTSATPQAGQQSNGSNNPGAPPSSTQSQAAAQTSVVPSQMAASASTTYQSSPLASQSRYAQLSMHQSTQAQLDHSNNSNGNSYSGATGAANHAANGLFLLSQAHQELTKREEAQKQSMAQSNGSTNAKGSASQNQAVQPTSNGASSTKRGSKRKVDTVSVSSSASAKAGASKKSKTSPVSTRGSTARRGSTAASISNPEGDDDGGMDEFEDSDEEPPASAGNKNKKPETEEEKRKNFLERNRQAALKCRQRKKQWLAQLQAKNEFLQNENERLTAALVSSREEISRLSQLVGGAGVGLPSGVVPMVGVGGMGVQQQQMHHVPYMAHQQQQHPISVPVSLPQSSSNISATAASPPIANKASPHMQQHHQQQQQQQQQLSPNPHSPTSDGRSSRSSLRDVRDYANGTARDANATRDYARDMREREMGHVHGHAPQAVAVNGRGYGY